MKCYWELRNNRSKIYFIKRYYLKKGKMNVHTTDLVNLKLDCNFKYHNELKLNDNILTIATLWE